MKKINFLLAFALLLCLSVGNNVNATTDSAKGSSSASASEGSNSTSDTEGSDKPEVEIGDTGEVKDPDYVRGEDGNDAYKSSSPVLELNGFSSINYASTHQTDASNGKGGAPHMSIGASNIYFTAKAKSANGLEYKFRSTMEAAPGGKGGMYFTDNYIELAHFFGVVQFGNLKGPAESIQEDGLCLIGGAGGIDGTFGSVINYAEGVIAGVSPYGATGRATKIVYYTPNLNGVTAGIAYTPNTNHNGKDGKNNAVTTPGSSYYGNESGIYPNKNGMAYGLNNIELGVKYDTNINKYNLVLAFVYVTEDSRRGGYNWVIQNTANPYDNNLEFFRFKNVKRANSVQFTAALGFDDWRFATGYINNGHSRLPNTEHIYATGNSGQSWNIAGQKTIGSYKLALGYFKTTRKLPKLPANTANVTNCNVSSHAKSDVVTATVDFNALKGLLFFAELDVFKMRTDKSYAQFVGTTKQYTDSCITPTSKNSGYAVIVGSKFSF